KYEVPLPLVEVGVSRLDERPLVEVGVTLMSQTFTPEQQQFMSFPAMQNLHNSSEMQRCPSQH
ncbi:MAG: hypothetical protein QMC95_18225, partial [Desulfitobacteriaceae bacterium]|nr:hypothetical protein [Desulfitobacteriaceae bacterium]